MADQLAAAAVSRQTPSPGDSCLVLGRTSAIAVPSAKGEPKRIAAPAPASVAGSPSVASVNAVSLKGGVSKLSIAFKSREIKACSAGTAGRRD